MREVRIRQLEWRDTFHALGRGQAARPPPLLFLVVQLWMPIVDVVAQPTSRETPFLKLHASPPNIIARRICDMLIKDEAIIAVYSCLFYLPCVRVLLLDNH
jgi:hypothetical protein